jgi:hypothetical protein
MADLVPHPLVIDVALTLGEDTGGHFERAATGLRSAAQTAGVEANSDAAQVADQQNTLAAVLANDPSVPELSLLAGYLGGRVMQGDEYRLLYLDALLSDWLLVKTEDIVANERRPAENEPAGVIDLLWVKSTADLRYGSGPRTNASRFLIGELTRAGDFAPSTRGGTFSAASGLLCEATTPGCCRYTRTTCKG